MDPNRPEQRADEKLNAVLKNAVAEARVKAAPGGEFHFAAVVAAEANKGPTMRRSLSFGRKKNRATSQSEEALQAEGKAPGSTPGPKNGAPLALLAA